MLTVLGYALLAIVLVAGLFFLGATLLPAGEQLAPAVRDEPRWAVAEGRAVTAEDIENVRLPIALRGYRFAETDELLDTLAEQLRWRDAEIARLRSGGGVAGDAADEVGEHGGWGRPAETDEIVADQPEKDEPADEPHEPAADEAESVDSDPVNR